jgi:DNA-binding Lrp family transcriptional regulator
MKNLDLKDRKILYELDKDARQSDTAIARKVRLSKDAVRYRIARLENEGYIQYFMTLLNSMKLGYDWYRTFFKLQNITLKQEEELISWLKKRASWITRVEGKWDLNTGIFCKDVYEYRDLINRFLQQYGAYIQDHDVAIVTREWTYHREYLLKKQKTTRPLLMGFGKKRELVEIDETDYAILKILLKQARMKTVDIARALGTTEMVVRYRMKKLKEQGVILGYKPFIDVKKLGFNYFKLHVQLQHLTKEKKKAIMAYIHQHPATVHMTELVSGADLECEFQVRNNQEFYDEIKALRLKFGDLIKSYEFMQYTDEYKFTYLPEMEF